MNRYTVIFTDGYSVTITATNESEAKHRACIAGRSVNQIARVVLAI